MIAALLRGLVILGVDVATIVCGLLAARLLAAPVSRVAARRATRFGTNVQTLVRHAAWIGVWLLMVTIILHNIGVTHVPLVTLSTIGLALGLAFQSLLANVIAGIYLLSEGIIRVGAEIQVNTDPPVVVEDIRTRVTACRDVATGRPRYYTNAQLQNSTVTIVIPAKEAP